MRGDGEGKKEYEIKHAKRRTVKAEDIELVVKK